MLDTQLTRAEGNEVDTKLREPERNEKSRNQVSLIVSMFLECNHSCCNMVTGELFSSTRWLQLLGL